MRVGGGSLEHLAFDKAEEAASEDERRERYQAVHTEIEGAREVLGGSLGDAERERLEARRERLKAEDERLAELATEASQ